MHLKSLTLKGFKSFAAATTLVFEPGVTCVVGPNGSGKSNVVDALAWVMGEQGAKTLRGAKMEDVIFAGTAGRPALGRAEVALTIDNADGALPIEYSEVTISRVMFRAGGSEYAINGTPARLLDVQELLSDSGIGREMHVVVGQGQLDQILHASPEDRRGFIEEAGGVLKHRKRKERALRKLDAMSVNLARVSDLAAELRRQLTPLGRQAEVARRANVVQADVRDASLRLLADELAGLREQYAAELADESALRERQVLVSSELAGLRAQEAVHEARAAAASPALKVQERTWFELSGLRERFMGLQGMAAERVRSLAPEPEDERRGRDPQELAAEGAALRAQEVTLVAAVRERRCDLDLASAARVAAEAELATEEARLRTATRSAADLRESAARRAGQAHAARSRVEARTSEIDRLRGQVTAARQRALTASQQFTALEASIAGMDAGEVDLDTGFEDAREALAAVEARVQELAARESAAERERAGWAARIEALAPLAAVADAGGALAAGVVAGVSDTLAAAIRVAPGYEQALGAALGAAADAAVATGPASAEAALAWLADSDGGRATVFVPGLGETGRGRWPDLPAHARYAVDLLTHDPAWGGSLAAVLDRVVVVDGDVAQAVALARAEASLLVVTRDGDVVGRGLMVGGSTGPPSRIEVSAALEEAHAQAERVGHDVQRLRFELSGLKDERTMLEAQVSEALDRLHESDARMAAIAEQLGALGQAARAATSESDRLERMLQASEEALAADRVTLAEIEAHIAAIGPDAEQPKEPDPDARDAAARGAETARRAETDARLALRTAEERARAATGRAEQLERAAASARADREAGSRRRERRAEAAAVAQAVGQATARALARLEVSLTAAAQKRDQAEAARLAADTELSELRARLRTLSVELSDLTDAVHHDEVARAEQRLRLETLETRALAEFGVEPDALVAEFGPHQLVAPSLRATGDEPAPGEPEPQPYPYDRSQQERRLRTAQKALALLGRVNPLALEEYAALEERHRFLTEQVDDLKRSRKDLLDLIGQVDNRVEEVFTAAFADTAAQFEQVFARLFPGGEGRLVLTDPADMLTTGIEIEARPPGKKVKRLSLLSGGERSLTALAFLVALFQARPNPFYVLDEIEAALDDVNLGRLLDVLTDLRQDSQLIVITHQKRTMEIADALYGVSMRGDGVTQVISQRLREPVPVGT